MKFLVGLLLISSQALALSTNMIKETVVPIKKDAAKPYNVISESAELASNKVGVADKRKNSIEEMLNTPAPSTYITESSESGMRKSVNRFSQVKITKSMAENDISDNNGLTTEGFNILFRNYLLNYGIYLIFAIMAALLAAGFLLAAITSILIDYLSTESYSYDELPSYNEAEVKSTNYHQFEKKKVVSI